MQSVREPVIIRSKSSRAKAAFADWAADPSQYELAFNETPSNAQEIKDAWQEYVGRVQTPEQREISRLPGKNINIRGFLIGPTDRDRTTLVVSGRTRNPNAKEHMRQALALLLEDGASPRPGAIAVLVTAYYSIFDKKSGAIAAMNLRSTDGDTGSGYVVEALIFARPDEDRRDKPYELSLLGRAPGGTALDTLAEFGDEQKIYRELSRKFTVAISAASSDQMLRRELAVFRAAMNYGDDRTSFDRLSYANGGLGEDFRAFMSRTYPTAIWTLFGALHAHLTLKPEDVSLLVSTVMTHAPHGKAFQLLAQELTRIDLGPGLLEELRNSVEQNARRWLQIENSFYEMYGEHIRDALKRGVAELNGHFGIGAVLPDEPESDENLNFALDQAVLTLTRGDADPVVIDSDSESSSPIKRSPSRDMSIDDNDEEAGGKQTTQTLSKPEGFEAYASAMDRASGRPLAYAEASDQVPHISRFSGGLYYSNLALAPPIAQYASMAVGTCIWHTHYRIPMRELFGSSGIGSAAVYEDAATDITVTMQDVWELLVNLRVYDNLQRTPDESEEQDEESEGDSLSESQELDRPSKKDGKVQPTDVLDRYKELYLELLNNSSTLLDALEQYIRENASYQEAHDSTGLARSLLVGDKIDSISKSGRLEDFFVSLKGSFVGFSTENKYNGEIDLAYAFGPFRAILETLARGEPVADLRAHVPLLQAFSSNTCVRRAAYLFDIKDRAANAPAQKPRNDVERHTDDMVLFNAMLGFVDSREKPSAYARLKRQANDSSFVQSLLYKATPGPFSAKLAARFADRAFFATHIETAFDMRQAPANAASQSSFILPGTRLPMLTRPMSDRSVVPANPYQAAATMEESILDGFVAAALAIRYPTFYAGDHRPSEVEAADYIEVFKMFARQAAQSGLGSDYVRDALHARYGSAATWIMQSTSMPLQRVSMFEKATLDIMDIAHIGLGADDITAERIVQQAALSALDAHYAPNDDYGFEAIDSGGSVRAWLRSSAADPDMASSRNTRIERSIAALQESARSSANEALAYSADGEIASPASVLQTLAPSQTGYSDLFKLYRVTVWPTLFSWSYVYYVQNRNRKFTLATTPQEKQQFSEGLDSASEEESVDVGFADESIEYVTEDSTDGTQQQQQPTDDPMITSDGDDALAPELSVSGDEGEDDGGQFAPTSEFERGIASNQLMVLIDTIASKNSALSGFSALGSSEYRGLRSAQNREAGSIGALGKFMETLVAAEKIAVQYSNDQAQLLAIELRAKTAASTSRYIAQLLVVLHSVWTEVYLENPGAQGRAERDPIKATRTFRDPLPAAVARRFLSKCEALWQDSLQGAQEIYREATASGASAVSPVVLVLTMLVRAERNADERAELDQIAQNYIRERGISLLDQLKRPSGLSSADEDETKKAVPLVDALDPKFELTGKPNLLHFSSKYNSAPLIDSTRVLASGRAGLTPVSKYISSLKLPSLDREKIEARYRLRTGNESNNDDLLISDTNLSRASILRDLFTSRDEGRAPTSDTIDFARPQVDANTAIESDIGAPTTEPMRRQDTMAVMQLYYARQMADSAYGVDRADRESYQPIVACWTQEKISRHNAGAITQEPDAQHSATNRRLNSLLGTLYEFWASAKQLLQRVGQESGSPTINNIDLAAYNQTLFAAWTYEELVDQPLVPGMQAGAGSGPESSILGNIASMIITTDPSADAMNKQFRKRQKVELVTGPHGLPSFRHTYGTVVTQTNGRARIPDSLAAGQKSSYATHGDIFASSLVDGRYFIGIYHIEKLSKAVLQLIKYEPQDLARLKFLAAANYIDSRGSEFAAGFMTGSASADLEGAYRGVRNALSAFAADTMYSQVSFGELFDQKLAQVMHAATHYYAKQELMRSVLAVMKEPPREVKDAYPILRDKGLHEQKNTYRMQMRSDIYGVMFSYFLDAQQEESLEELNIAYRNDTKFQEFRLACFVAVVQESAIFRDLLPNFTTENLETAVKPDTVGLIELMSALLNDALMTLYTLLPDEAEEPEPKPQDAERAVSEDADSLDTQSNSYSERAKEKYLLALAAYIARSEELAAGVEDDMAFTTFYVNQLYRRYQAQLTIPDGVQLPQIQPGQSATSQASVTTLQPRRV